jgi:hypothetical protein
MKKASWTDYNDEVAKAKKKDVIYHVLEILALVFIACVIFGVLFLL